jgi:hypothetical protein
MEDTPSMDVISISTLTMVNILGSEIPKLLKPFSENKATHQNHHITVAEDGYYLKKKFLPNKLKIVTLLLNTKKMNIMLNGTILTPNPMNLQFMVGLKFVEKSKLKVSFSDLLLMNLKF